MKRQIPVRPDNLRLGADQDLPPIRMPSVPENEYYAMPQHHAMQRLPGNLLFLDPLDTLPYFAGFALFNTGLNALNAKSAHSSAVRWPDSPIESKWMPSPPTAG